MRGGALAVCLALGSALLLFSALAEDPAAAVLDPAAVYAAQLDAAASALVARRAAELETATAGAERLAELRAQLDAAASAADVDALYDAVVAELSRTRPALREALDARHAPTTIPAPPADLVAAADLATLAPLRERRETLLATERDVLRDAVFKRASVNQGFDDVRTSAITRLSKTKRERLVGFTREGAAQLGRELLQTNLSLRTLWVVRRYAWRTMHVTLSDVFRAGNLVWALLQIVAVAGALVLVRARGRIALEDARRAAHRRIESFAWRRRVDGIAATVAVVLPWATFLIALWLVRRIAGDVALWPEFDIPYRLAVFYGFYRLAIDGLCALLTGAARRYSLRLDASRRDLLLRSVRSLARVATGLAVWLWFTYAFVGRGFLYSLAARLGWLLFVVAGLVILSRWRAILSETYLASRPEGRLADLVRTSGTRWYGIVIAVPASLVLASRAATIVARDFALRFDQTRKALAFVFRQRVEKRAQQTGYADTEATELPAALATAFSPLAPAPAELTIDCFPGLDVARYALAEFSRGRARSLAVFGERRVGKTTWLSRFDTGELPVTRLEVRERLLTPGALAESLAAGLLPDSRSSISDVGALRSALRGGPERVVVLDGAQNFFLSTLGGHLPFSAFADLVDQTASRVFWVASFNHFAWVHLRAVHREHAVFSDVVELHPWKEDNIAALLRKRLEASGTTVTYEDLVVTNIEGLSTPSTLLQTEESYMRLVWDFTDGNPGAALLYWMRSLVPDRGGRVRVRFFRAPAAEDLQNVGETALFVLASIVVHENLTLEEAQRATRFPLAVTRIHLDRLLALGAIEEERGRYRMTALWQPVAMRLLRRRNLLSD